MILIVIVNKSVVNNLSLDTVISRKQIDGEWRLDLVDGLSYAFILTR